jgi:hypothetical protein
LGKRKIATQIAFDGRLQHPPLRGQLVDVEALEVALRLSVPDLSLIHI